MSSLPLNQIINGDCMEMLSAIPDKSVDLIVTDPPYFLPVNSYVGVRGEGYSKRTLADTSILKVFFEKLMENLDRITKQEGTFYLFCDGQSYPIFYQAMYPYCSHVRPLIWDKVVSYNGYTWRHQHEIIAWGEKKDSQRIPTGDGDVLKCRGVLQKDRNHPAEKPVELLAKIIGKHKTEGMVVLDPFCGSGSTCVAAKSLGLNYIGIEYNPEYVKTAEERLAVTPVSSILK